ncbi:MAG: hypothetical protein KJ709_03075 [Nanoarchaeota archaeon]|nr:hypothetical protein [Nanoarchaeota archaeon]
MYHQHDPIEEHSGYSAKKYGAAAGTEDILKDGYHGHDSEDIEYMNKDKYQSEDTDELYHTGAAEDDEDKEKEESEWEKMLEEDEKKKEEQHDEESAIQTQAMPEHHFVEHDRPKTVEEIIAAAFKKKGKKGTGEDG